MCLGFFQNHYFCRKGAANPNFFTNFHFLKYLINIRDIFGEGSKTLWVAWNRIVKQLFDLPFATHTNLLPAISGVDHIQLTVIKRFSKFYEKLRDTRNRLKRNLFVQQHRDLRSCFGKNCNELRVMTGSQDFCDNISTIEIHKLPEDEEWRVYIVRDLVSSLKAGWTYNYTQYTE